MNLLIAASIIDGCLIDCCMTLVMLEWIEHNRRKRI